MSTHMEEPASGQLEEDCLSEDSGDEEIKKEADLVDPESDIATELTGDWLAKLRPPVETGALNMQILDVQVVDEMPRAFTGSKDDAKGETFLLDVLEHADDSPRPRASRCTVLLFGTTELGASVCVRVTDFKPSLLYDMPANVKQFCINMGRALQLPADELVTRQVLRKHSYGWIPNSMDHPTGRKDIMYLQVFFPTMKAMRRATYSTSLGQFHEDKVPYDTKFMDEANLTPSGWVCVLGRPTNTKSIISHCVHEIECTTQALQPMERLDVAPMLVAFMDIECVSDNLGFPDAEQVNDHVVQIGVNYWRVGQPKEAAVKVLYVTPSYCGPVDGAYVVRFESERDMLSGWRSSCLVDCDVDVIAHYNGFGFDMPYLFRRAEMLNVDDFFYFDRVITRKCRTFKKDLSSGGLGDNELFLVDTFGRTSIDIFYWIKAQMKLDSYKLDVVGKLFIGDQKVDMPYKLMFKWARGTPKQVARVGVYCLQDCFLLVQLAIHFQIFTCNVEMSRVTHTPMEALETRGQQIKVINQLVWSAHRKERRTDGNGSYILNTPKAFSGGPSDSYMGATVIDAKAKFYKEPIATLDFMSLYPSIILANNFCSSCLVQDDAFANIPGVEYVEIIVDNKRYLWAKNFAGVIPDMIVNLLSARKGAKKLMNAAIQRIQALKEERASAAPERYDDIDAEIKRVQIQKAVYNARQLALKISANSIYGFMGAVKTGKYHCLAVADCVTFRAREMLNHTVDLVLGFAKCEVVYGDTDSVMVRFFDVADVEECADVARKAADFITAKFTEETGTNFIVLEFEKIYRPYLLMRKKRYAGLMYEEDKQGKMAVTKLDAKGIELVRRDNCPVAKRIQKKTLDALMYKRDPELACREINEELTLIVEDRVSLDDYRISKGLRKTYKTKDLPHLEVVRKMAAREPGSEPQIGDRVPYVLLQVKNRPKAKTFEKAEDISYAKAHPDECKIDRLYYVEHQIIKPIIALMEHVIDDPQRLFANATRALTHQQTNQRTLLSMGFDTGKRKEPVDLEDEMFALNNRRVPPPPPKRRQMRPSGPKK